MGGIRVNLGPSCPLPAHQPVYQTQRERPSLPIPELGEEAGNHGRAVGGSGSIRGPCPLTLDAPPIFRLTVRPACLSPSPIARPG